MVLSAHTLGDTFHPLGQDHSPIAQPYFSICNTPPGSPTTAPAIIAVVKAYRGEDYSYPWILRPIEVE